MRYQAVFFDFDGVILDSVHVKTKAFAAMFRQYGPKVERQVVDFHLANGGMSRFKKFEHYYRNILNMDISQKELDLLGNKFSELALQGVIESPFIPGAIETLKSLNSDQTPCFIASGTPDDEIKYIVQHKNLTTYFLEVHGSPKEKSAIVSEMIVKHNLASNNCLFIGDAMSDYCAAQETGLNFLGIVKEQTTSPFPEDTWVKKEVTLND
ncbi:HAD family hydrolase [Desulfonatronovibrio magnus]|uniref:HAD family hydrolase n=1 Tax=Desulfonatronovibrio magnus TaxID=698827 RepID=UPI0005EBC081|nr:HAD-IA family hydrolase [Desulfonatronovibrio magnus]